MPSFRKSVAIDLGTSDVLVYVNDKGIVKQEPSVIAKDIITDEILAVGRPAKKIIGRTPGNVVAIKPLEDGVIKDFDATEKMLKYFLKSSMGKSWFKPDVLICIPSKEKKKKKRAVLQAAENAGAHRAYLIEEVLAAALGAEIDIADPKGSMVIDIGAGTTDIAVISMGQVITSKSVDISGDTFDQALIDHMRDRYKIFMGQISAEEIKIRASAMDIKDSIEIRGRQVIDGLPARIIVPIDEIYHVFIPIINKIITAVKDILKLTPPQLAADLYDSGIILTGGGSLTLGLQTSISEKLQIKVRIAEEPKLCVIRGTANALTWIDSIDEEKNESKKSKQKQLELKERLRRR